MNRILLSCLLVGIAFLSCNKEDAPRQVEYSIGCTDCEVIYTISGGQQMTEYNKNSEWSFTFSGKQGDILMLLAYNTGAIAQGVTARIQLNDEILKEQTRYCAIAGYSFVVDTLE